MPDTHSSLPDLGFVTILEDEEVSNKRASLNGLLVSFRIKRQAEQNII